MINFFGKFFVFSFFINYFIFAEFVEKEDKKFIIIIPSYNNEKFVERNISSVLKQNYNNFRIVYINDSSTDLTGKLVFDYFNHSGFTNFIIINNLINKGALNNIYNVIHAAEDDEIVCLLDGDDWFAHGEVLNILNNYYQNPNIWLTYGQYEVYPTGMRGHCKKIPDHILKNGQVRSYEWVTSHLRTFYAGLFKRIEKKDFLYNGKFLEMAWDLAIMFPLIEMSSEKCKFIDEVLYVYNRTNPLNDDKKNKKKQIFLDKYVRRQHSYSRLNSWKD